MTTISRILFASLGLGLASIAHAVTLQLNFGNAASLTGWNDIPRAVAQTSNGTVSDLVDSAGAPTEVDFTMVARFNGVNQAGASTGSTTNGFVGIPNEVIASSFYGNDANFEDGTFPNPTFRLSGLDKRSTYTIKVYASRVGASEDRSAVYTATGLKPVSGMLNASNNINVVLTLSDVVPDVDGNITFDLAKAAANRNNKGFIYLNALTLTSAEIPEPSSYRGTK